MQSNKDWRMWTIFIIKFSCFAEIDKSKKVKKNLLCLHSRSYEVTGKVCVVELEMSLVVEL